MLSNILVFIFTSKMRVERDRGGGEIMSLKEGKREQSYIIIRCFLILLVDIILQNTGKLTARIIFSG